MNSYLNWFKHVGTFKQISFSFSSNFILYSSTWNKHKAVEPQGEVTKCWCTKWLLVCQRLNNSVMYSQREKPMRTSTRNHNVHQPQVGETPHTDRQKSSWERKCLSPWRQWTISYRQICDMHNPTKIPLNTCWEPPHAHHVLGAFSYSKILTSESPDDYQSTFMCCSNDRRTSAGFPQIPLF